MTQSGQIFSMMDSAKDISIQSTPLEVRTRSRIPVRSPGGGFKSYGSASSSSPNRDLGCKQRQTKSQTSPQGSGRTSSGGLIFLTPVEIDEKESGLNNDTLLKPLKKEDAIGHKMDAKETCPEDLHIEGLVLETIQLKEIPQTTEELPDRATISRGGQVLEEILGQISPPAQPAKDISQVAPELPDPAELITGGQNRTREQISPVQPAKEIPQSTKDQTLGTPEPRKHLCPPLPPVAPSVHHRHLQVCDLLSQSLSILNSSEPVEQLNNDDDVVGDDEQAKGQPPPPRLISPPPPVASSPHLRVGDLLLSRSVSIWDSSEVGEQMNFDDGDDGDVDDDRQGLGLSILPDGEGTLSDKIVAAFFDCFFCA